jgi:hypothetical protein
MKKIELDMSEEKLERWRSLYKEKKRGEKKLILEAFMRKTKLQRRTAYRRLLAS